MGSDTVWTQNPPESVGKLKFPRTIAKGKGRNTAAVVIYGKTPARPSYRVAFYEGGKRIQQSFTTYSAALEAAEKTADELAKQGKAPALTRGQLADAQAALEVLGHYNQAAGKKLSLLVMAKEYIESAKRIGERPLSEAITGFLSTMATVKRVPIQDAVKDYLAGVQSKTKPAKPGERAQLSWKYYDHLSTRLNAFADALPGHDVADLTKEHLDIFFNSLGKFTAKTRNHYRNAVAIFLRWAAAKDYLPANHRLFESPGMSLEKANTHKIEIFTAAELQTLLAAAQGELRPAIAILALAGVRVEELLRLSWRDVWRVPGHIEANAAITKTRKRRLVEIGPALRQWLEPYREIQSGPVWTGTESMFQKAFTTLCADCSVPRRRNALRHSWFSYRLAILQDAAKVALEGGNSPQMIFQHYRELVTKSAAEKWFAIAPSKAAENVINLNQASA